jgi:dolichol-phosphate mannosyltransferase
MAKLGIIVLAFNEIDSLEETILGINETFVETKPDIVISTSRAGSIGCQQMAQGLSHEFANVRVHFQQEPFVGAAVMEAVALLDTEYVIYMSADGETPFEACGRLFSKILETNSDIVSASRWIPGGSFSNYGKIKMIVSLFAQNLCKIVFSSRLSEFTYGFRIYRREVLTKCNFLERKHPFFLETILVPIRLGFKVDEIPVNWRPRDEAFSVVNMRILLSYFKPIFLVKTRAFRKLLK